MKTLDFIKIKGFDWDTANKAKSFNKHKVRYKECEEIFYNKPLIIYPDEKHSQVESRHSAFGKTDRKKRLTVIFTIRKNMIRVISARPQSKKERKEYEKQKA